MERLLKLLRSADIINVWLALIGALLVAAIALIWPGAITWPFWPVLLVGLGVWAYFNSSRNTSWVRLAWFVAGCLIVQIFCWI